MIYPLGRAAALRSGFRISDLNITPRGYDRHTERAPQPHFILIDSTDGAHANGWVLSPEQLGR